MTLFNIHTEQRGRRGGEGRRDGRTGCPSLNPLSAGSSDACCQYLSIIRPVPSQKSDREGGRGSNPHFLGATSPLHPEISCLLSGCLPLLLISLCPRVVLYSMVLRCVSHDSLTKTKDKESCLLYLLPLESQKWTGMRVLSLSPCRISLLPRLSKLPTSFPPLLLLPSHKRQNPLLKKEKLIILSSSPRPIDFSSHQHHHQSFLLISLPNKPKQRLLVVLRQSTFSSSPARKR